MDRVVEAHLQYLRGVGGEPDLSDLSDPEREAVARMLDLVEALADSLPTSPPIDEDAVAVALGLNPTRRFPQSCA
jgi:dsDNA-binding SOS-regulon protein